MTVEATAGAASLGMGNDMDTYADDLLQLFEHLDLKDVMMAGHSTGGGEVARFCGRHGTSRVMKAILIGAVPPIMVQSESNASGTPLSVFHSFRDAINKVPTEPSSF